MSLPIDRTKLAIAQANQTPGLVASATANINALTNAYDTIDELNGKVDTHAQASVLPHPDGSVTTAKIANGAVTNIKLATGAVTTDKIADLAVTTPKIASKAVTESKMDDASVSRRTIVTGAVGAMELDPSLLQQYGTAATNAKFQLIDTQFVQRGVNVKSMPAPFVSAKGDDSVDDSSALNAAFANFSHVIIPEGTYRIDSTLTISNTVTIEGVYGKTLIKNYGPSSAFQLKTKCEIYGILQTAVVNGSSQHGILISASHCIIKDCEFQGNGGYGIKFDPTVHVVNASVSNTTIFANQLGGVYCVTNVTYQKTAIHFDACYVVSNGSQTDPTIAQTTGGHGFELGACLGVSVTNTVCEYNKGCGIYIAEEGIYGVFNVVVTGCYFEGNRRANIHLNNMNATLAYKGILIKANYYSVYPAVGPTYYTNSLLPTSMRTIVQNESYVTESMIDEKAFGFQSYNNVSIDTAGVFNGPQVRSTTYAGRSGDTQGKFVIGTGITIDRDISDAVPTVKIRNINASNTGNILELYTGTADQVFTFPKSGDFFNVKYIKTPASATATGTRGDICYDANYIYVCVATNTWKRAALSTW